MAAGLARASSWNTVRAALRRASVRGPAHPYPMVAGLLVCSDDECTEVFEAVGPIEELLTLACDCDCALELVGWPEQVDGVDGRGHLVSLIALPA